MFDNPGTNRPKRAERGFSLIEVIIALTILSVVLSGAAMAVVSSDSAEMSAKTVADSHAMAEKAIERLRNDLTARSGCDNGGWLATARTAKTKTTATPFAECLVTYNDMKDAKGRSYSIGLVVRAVDDPSDGIGANDSDGDVRDSYEVKAKVDLAQNSKAGREKARPIDVGGAVDWERGSSDDATINVVACGIDRPDRALMAGGCAVGDASRQPLTVTMTVRRVNEEQGSQSNYGTATSGGSALNVRPGAYRFEAPATVTAGGVKFTLLKVDPADVRASGSTNYTVQATYVRSSMTTRVCTQIANKGTNDDGYEVRAANIHYRRANHPGLRSNRLVLNDDRTWNCSGTFKTVHKAFAGTLPNGDHILRDPVENSPQSLYRGLYDLEVEQVNRRIPTHHAGLYVMEASLNCNKTQWNKSMGGTKLLTRSRDQVLDRKASADQNRASWLARVPITANTGDQTICIRFYSRPFERERCMQPNHKAKGCFYVKTTCSLPKGVKDDDNKCENGAEVCVANCGNGSGKPQGTAGAFNYTTHNGWVSGGPNDPTVACRPHSGYTWPGKRHLAWGTQTNVNKGTRDSYDWIGGSNYYYANYSGRNAAHKNHPWGVHPDAKKYNLPDHPVYNCTKSYFTAGSATIKNGYPFYTCIEVYVPGRSHIRVRGRVLDISGSAPGFYASVGAAIALAPDSPRMNNYWNPFGGAGGFPNVTNGGNWPSYKVAKVTGDPICDSGSGPVFEHVDPIITEIWERIVDDPQIYPLPDRPQTDLGTDRIGV